MSKLDEAFGEKQLFITYKKYGISFAVQIEELHQDDVYWKERHKFIGLKGLFKIRKIYDDAWDNCLLKDKIRQYHTGYDMPDVYVSGYFISSKASNIQLKSPIPHSSWNFELYKTKIKQRRSVQG